MASPLLILANTQGFRTNLLKRNLTPYAKAPNRPTQPIDTVYTQSDSSVQDSPDKLIDEPSYANKLFPLNQYGNEGGYKQVPDPGALLNTKSNEGIYNYQDADIVLGLMCPYKLDMDTSLGYDLSKLKDKMLMLKIIKNRLSRDGIAKGLYVKPESGKFFELPAPDSLEINNYYNQQI